MRQISLTIEDVEFEKFLELIKSFKSIKNLQSDTLENSYELNNLQLQELENRRENHLKGISKSLTFDEIKSKLKK